eukprot:CAMPEP_0115641282 /NCGR_PEP_ID=MMETSP0272-20121206/36231_1 /TAXON_ID=71861 /ORGANISM="Scrippsiella trochoidea, Strain CCMP3099" /LENGTH=38 /DNA_ID= /DNA_START= /DNA_END= /DNA_ORIENTATION=
MDARKMRPAPADPEVAGEAGSDVDASVLQQSLSQAKPR